MICVRRLETDWNHSRATEEANTAFVSAINGVSVLNGAPKALLMWKSWTTTEVK